MLYLFTASWQTLDETTRRTSIWLTRGKVTHGASNLRRDPAGLLFFPLAPYLDGVVVEDDDDENEERIDEKGQGDDCGDQDRTKPSRLRGY